MATVVRAPFYVPRPSEDTVWQGRPRGSTLLAPLLTSVKMFGVGGQAPTKRQRFDHDSGESFWLGRPTPSALLAPLLTAVKMFGVGGQAPTKRPRFDFDGGETFWPGRPTARNLNVLIAGATTPFVNSAWRFGVADDAVWQAQPDGAPVLQLLTAVKMFGAGGQAPTKRARFDNDCGENFWQFEAIYNLALIGNLQFPVARGGEWSSPDDPASWQPVPQRNLNALSATPATTPFFNPSWKFGYVEDPGWQGQPDSSAPLQLLTAVKMFGAGGQAPTKRQRFDFDVGESFWTGRPTPSALLAPLLTAVKMYGAGGQAPTSRPRFDYDVGESFWTGRPTARNLNVLIISAATPFANSVWKFGIADETGWQGQADGAPVLQLLTAVKMFGAGGQAATKRPRFDYDSGESFWVGGPTRSVLLAPILTIGGQVPTRRWLFGWDDPSAWQASPGRNGNLLTVAAPSVPFVGQPWRFVGEEAATWRARSSRNLSLWAGPRGSNPRYIIGYSHRPIRSLNYPVTPKRKLP